MLFQMNKLQILFFCGFFHRNMKQSRLSQFPALLCASATKPKKIKFPAVGPCGIRNAANPGQDQAAMSFSFCVFLR